MNEIIKDDAFLSWNKIILFFSRKIKEFTNLSLFSSYWYSTIVYILYNTARLNMCHEEDFSARYTDRGSVKGQISL